MSGFLLPEWYDEIKKQFCNFTNKNILMTQRTFTNDGEFFKTLKARVNTALRDHTKGDYRLYIKTIILLTSAVVLYLLPYFILPTLGACIMIGIGRGFVMGLIGFNVGHDALHGSYSNSKNLNAILGLTFDISGASSFFWKTKHNILHHTYTNEELDDDIETGNMLRLAPWQKYHWIYKIQWLYAFLLYCVLHIQWVFYNDIQKKLTGKIGNTDIPKMNKRDNQIFWFGKFVYITKSLIIPMIFIGWWQGLLMYLVMEATCGLVISVVFQLAHVQNKSQFENTSNEWSIHQLQTTADFATRNPVVTWLLGGLNFQAIHHLFPRVSHIHYPKIQKIVKDTCREFDIKYLQYKTMTGAIADHVVYLWKRGRSPHQHYF
jgi:linoleoyl-CoA desaturase